MSLPNKHLSKHNLFVRWHLMPINRDLRCTSKNETNSICGVISDEEMDQDVLVVCRRVAPANVCQRAAVGGEYDAERRGKNGKIRDIRNP